VYHKEKNNANKKIYKIYIDSKKKEKVFDLYKFFTKNLYIVSGCNYYLPIGVILDTIS
jgi:hypothetical protein